MKITAKSAFKEKAGIGASSVKANTTQFDVFQM